MAMATLRDKVLQYLSSQQKVSPGGIKLRDIVTKVGMPKDVVNSELYELERLGKVEHVSVSPPVWRLPAYSGLPVVPVPNPAAASGCVGSSSAFTLPVNDVLGAVATAAATAARDDSNQLGNGCEHLVILSGAATAAPRATAEAAESSVPVQTCPVATTAEATCCTARKMLLNARFPDVNSAGPSSQPNSHDVEERDVKHELLLCQQMGALSTGSLAGEAAGNRSSLAREPITTEDNHNRDKILNILEAAIEAIRPAVLSKQLGIATKDAKRVLYSLQRDGLAIKLDGRTPTWMLASKLSASVITVKEASDNLKVPGNSNVTDPANFRPIQSAAKVALTCSPIARGTDMQVGPFYLMLADDVVTDVAGGNASSFRKFTEIHEKFKKARTLLIEELDKDDVLHIMDLLYQNDCINEAQKDRIQAQAEKNVRRDTARSLVDVVHSLGDEGVRVLLDGLRSEVIRKESLAQKMLDMT